MTPILLSLACSALLPVLPVQIYGRNPTVPLSRGQSQCLSPLARGTEVCLLAPESSASTAPSPATTAMDNCFLFLVPAMWPGTTPVCSLFHRPVSDPPGMSEKKNAPCCTYIALLQNGVHSLQIGNFPE